MSGDYSTLALFGPQTNTRNYGVFGPAVGSYTPTPTPVSVGGGTPFEPSFMDSLLGWKDTKTGVEHGGWGGMALGLGQGLLNGFMGMKQYGIMKDSLEESKRQFNTNFDAQKTMVNSQLEDRQRARVASNPSAYESVGTYMDKNRI